ncbi:putative SAM-dependent methyltransferase [Desulforapulum autotrophicum HRM2]|uniref:SAM-dependent methyltransferase n=1 Tax=Desulforapulum autotrophicum (strain ATCC 43914 / DSM 3382 / VKM B-1955 / HRM2) TaxID=177437 RepID=C0QG70_DESAH|nr:class I SAM-dependent methyltransferase [Desulforapulum autotrophicum]ACN17649.1 putative SAM-dependent methyltransferase [Desulforapulum autotrophicum HRM2]
MGYIFDSNDARFYDAWFDKACRGHAFNLEMDLLLRMLAPHECDRILDIGCGTGRSLEPLLSKGLHLTGVDPSTPMLDIARGRLGEKVDLHQGSAEALPFEDNAFDHAILFTSLEFTERPAKAVEEACRVARKSVIIGVFNSHAPLNLLRRIKNIFVSTPFSQAHYFSIWELKKILYAILGDVPLTWRTTLQFPWCSGPLAGFIEQQALVERSPLGTMIIMKIKPVPKFRIRPLWLRVKLARNYDPVSGFARIIHKEHKNGDSCLRKAG